jgi:ABC-type uncharacterized transport system substrate-binding protein
MERSARILAGALALAVSGGMPQAASGHPHVFIDAGVDFLFDPEGRLAHLRVTWLYDHLYTLLLLEDLGIRPGEGGAITDDDRAALAHDQSQWIDGYDGDATLRHGGARIGLSRPIEPQADYRDGQVEIRFLRALETPIRPDDTTVVKLYDPTYFVAYYVEFPPTLEHAPEGCALTIIPFEPSGPLVALQQSLFDLPPDEDPDEPVGHLFADEIRVTCD